MNVLRTVKFMLKNTNPIDINIEKILSTLPKANIRLLEMQLLNGTDSKISYKTSYQKDDIVEVRLNK